MGSPLLAQTRLELTVTLRNGESLLVTLGIPVGCLLFFSTVDVLPIQGDAVDFLAPGVLALAVMSTAFANLAISTGFDRSYGVLKRLGVTPLGRRRLVGAKTLATLGMLLIQTAVLVPVALALGWRPEVEAFPLILATVLATTAFCGLALSLAGRLPALVTLAAANGTFLLLLVLSGMMFPVDKLPWGIRALTRLLPSTALTEALHGSLDPGTSIPARIWPVLLVWAAASVAVATSHFRWDPDR
jgi:ABC-2 type transport system permease protein